jgi:hypothetical protein
MLFTTHYCRLGSEKDVSKELSGHAGDTLKFNSTDSIT